MLETLVVTALATWQAVDIYNDSDWEVIADIRSFVQAYEDTYIHNLLECKWCTSVVCSILLSVYVSFACLIAPPGQTSLYWLLMAPVMGLAASKLANTLHDLKSLVTSQRPV